MGKIKIIFFDIDGTLLRLRAKELSEKTVEALNRLKANGIRLCIATGRTPVSLPHFSGIEFDAFLTFNGSLFLQSVHYLVNVILYIESSDQSMGQAIIVNAILGNILADFIGNFF